MLVNIVGEYVDNNNDPPEIRFLTVRGCQLATETDRKGRSQAELKCQNNMVVLGESKKLHKEEK
jgi:hypothetical protein